MRRSAKSRPVANVMLAYLLLWVLYDLWETQASPDTRYTCLVIGLGIFFLAALPDAFQWSLLAGHRRFWSLLGVLRNEGSFCKLREGLCGYLESEGIDVVEHRRTLVGCIIASAIGFSLFAGSISLT